MDGTQPEWAPPLPVEHFSPEEPDPAQQVVIDGRSFLPLALLYKTPLSSVSIGLDMENFENVVLKSVRAGVNGDLRGHDTRDRLRNEYKVLRELFAHGGVAPRPVAFLEGDPAVLVMEDIDGISLDELPGEAKLRFVAPLASNVARLHELGYVHGDIKLSNCLVAGAELRLIDFGLAAKIGTQGGPMAGTPMYVPPEGVAGTVNVARDLHALGVCVAHAVLEQDPSQLPYKSGRLIGLLHLAEAHRSAEVVSGLIAKAPERRTPAADAAALLQHLPDEINDAAPAPGGYTPDAAATRWLKRAVLEAGFATRNYLEPSPDGHWWRNDHFLADYACEGINLGAAGIILGLASIDSALGRRFFDGDINAGADWLTSQGPMSASGFFTGNAGVALALSLVARRNGRKELVSHVRSRLEAATVTSTEYDLFSGAAGVIWAACLISEILQERWPLEVGKVTAQSLREAAQYFQDVWVWPPSEAIEEANPAPFLGAAHGSAGIAMALALWGRATVDGQAVQLATDTFKSLYRSGRAENRKTLLYKLNDEHQPAAIANWCHGTAGFLWCLLQTFGDDPLVAEEIDWAVHVLAEMPRVLAINPTYCHGLSGLLELWRIVSGIPRFRMTAVDRSAILAATLRLMHYRLGGKICWSSDDPAVITPDLWIGFLAPATALALYSINYPHALLSEQWLKKCAHA
jgi:hypothetical protein